MSGFLHKCDPRQGQFRGLCSDKGGAAYFGRVDRTANGASRRARRLCSHRRRDRHPGTFAIQLAKHVGAIVATTTSTANVDLVKRLGADIVIDYKKDAFEEVLRDCDVVLNSLDGETVKKSFRVLKPGGKLISISGPPDPEFAR